MKLRNKKTGEIIELLAKPSFVKRNDDYSQSEVNTFNSLAELNSEWEDMPEEPKVYWFINDLDGKPMKWELRYCHARDFTEWCEKRKQIGNYFETKEEAEKAVERLCAWKRLKDNGFRFTDWKFTPDMKHIKGNFVTIKAKIPYIVENQTDLAFLFGGEE